MLKEFVDKIIGLKRPEIIESQGRTYRIEGYTPEKDPYPSHMEINNLTGIVDFVKSSPEGWGGYFIQVRDFDKVFLFQPAAGSFNQRVSIIEAESRKCKFSFGYPLDVEKFIIALNGMFLPTEDRDYLLKFVSNIKIDANAQVKDDGVSQTVTARQGVSSLVKEIPIKPLVNLQPFRTFNEVDQPVSQFVFRMKMDKESGSATCALHECDGEAWKQESIQNIKKFLTEALPEIPVIA